jgi:hypothetical protein
VPQIGYIDAVVATEPSPVPYLSAWLAFLLLLGVGLFHVYWGLGGHWPGHDDSSLARYVMGGPEGSRLPAQPVVLTLGIFLVALGLIPLASAGIIPVPDTFDGLCSLALHGAAIVFALRGVGGYFEQRIKPSPPGTPYIRLNRWFYSPLSLVIATLMLAVRA